jgi:hypothetical protein
MSTTEIKKWNVIKAMISAAAAWYSTLNKLPTALLQSSYCHKETYQQ